MHGVTERTDATENGEGDDDAPTCTCWFVDGPFGNCSSYDSRCPRCHGTGVPDITTQHTTAPTTDQ